MHLIFDMDGTLIDSRPGIIASLETAVQKVYPLMDTHQLHFTIGPQIHDILRLAIEQATDAELATLEIAFRIAYDNQGWKNSLIYPGVTATIEELLKRGDKLYILTNKPKLPTSQILKYLGLSDYFRDVISPDSDQPKFRNKAAMLIYLLNKHAIPLDDTFCIGDSEDDFLAAQAYNVRFIGIEYGYGILPSGKNISKRLSLFSEILSVR
ncbi:MAG: HAD hydrolase-like protein [Chloroflexi bacterium]|nr:HAD hydrolase-like protein [Chloroflexota bacterium]